MLKQSALAAAPRTSARFWSVFNWPSFLPRHEPMASRQAEIMRHHNHRRFVEEAMELFPGSRIRAEYP